MKSSSSDVNAALNEIIRTLEALKKDGHPGFDCSDRGLEVVRRWENEEIGSAPAAPVNYASSVSAAVPETLERIRSELGDCRRCGLSRTRTHVVFGAGNPSAGLMFVGEGPGREEDLQGEPFVGAAGQLLTRIIHAIRLDRSQVYICNIIKCRPPDNRNPEPDEIRCCLPFLERQIAAIKPDFICTLGNVAARSLLETETPVSRLRGRFHDYRGIRVLPTYHPAYLLRHPEKKREVWEDMQKLMKVYMYED